jgi:hypothetical protein
MELISYIQYTAERLLQKELRPQADHPIGLIEL